jgi:hypothetical protein
MPSSKGKTPPRDISKKELQLTIRVPLHYGPILDEIAERGSGPGLSLTRSDAVRQIMAVGIDVMQKRPTINK